MSIDWKKYGIDQSDDDGTGIDWSKYQTKSQQFADDTKNQMQQFQALTGIKTVLPTVNDIQALKPVAGPPAPTNADLPGRDLPVVGPILRGLDWVEENPYRKKAGEIVQELYTPGAGLGAIASTTNAVEGAVGRLLPKIANPTSLGGKVAKTAITEGAVGVPLAMGQSLASGNTDLGEATKQGLYGALLGGATGGAMPVIGSGLKKFAGSKIGESLTNFLSRKKTPLEQQVDEILALPAAGETYRSPEELEREARKIGLKVRSQGTEIPTGETVYGQGDIAPPLALPAGNYIKPQRLKVAGNNETLNSVMERIKPVVTQRMTPPMENPTELARYVQKHLGASMNELRQLPYNDLMELATEVSRNLDTYSLSIQAARELGYDLPRLLEGKGQGLSDRIASDAQKRVYGIVPERVNIKQPEGFNVSVTGKAEAPRQQLVYRPGEQPKAKKPLVAPKLVADQPTIQPKAEPIPGAFSEPVRTVQTNGKVTDELKFGQTVRTSDNTAQELVDELNRVPLQGSRTSDVQNRQEAGKLIQKHGMEGLYSKLMAKHMKFSAAESTAAQMLAKHYSSLGGKENMEKAISLVSRTAREGRELGQAIQALTQWNKMDETGALLLGERQLNRGVSNTAEWKSLTPEQATPIQEAAQRIGKAEEAKGLADEVLSIVTNKKPGEALTDAEKATIKRFQDQVKEINEKAKPFLPKPKAAAQETIEKVSKIKPKERTRDQVVNFLDAKAELARKRLEKRRNVGIVAQLDNPVVDYAIIGASHIAKGVRNLTDYSELMVRDFGDQVKPYVKDAYLKSVNMFRKENGLPTVEELERVVNHAIKENKIDEELAKSLRVAATEIGFMSKEFKLEATQDLQKALKGLGQSTLGQKISTIQTAAQLLNMVTIERNVIGGAAQLLTEKVNKLFAVPIDYAFSKLTKERTIRFLPGNQESMWRNFLLGTKSGWEGVSPTGTLSSYDIHPDVFGEKNPLKYLTKMLGASLQGFDYAAYRSAYGDVLATYAEQLGKSQKLTKDQIKQQMPQLIEQLDQQIYELADRAGLYATFQDDTLLSQGAEMLKKGLNKITDKPVQGLVSRGLLPKSLSTEGFGLGDIVLKYARTPANLVMRGIDYSPLGFLRGTMELLPLFVKGGKFDQFAATRSLSRAITGTLGFTGLGFALADAGILSGAASMDKDTRSIQEQSGQGAYKVNWSALGRYLMGGFNKEAAKYQEGDMMMDYAWIQPAAISLAMGVNANKATKDMEMNESASGWKTAADALLGGLRTVLENPMVQGLSNVIDAGTDIIKRQDTDKAKGILKGVPASFVPTLLNQGRTSTDNNQRETFDESLLTEMVNLVKNKVPGLSKTLPISYNSLGTPRERIQGGEANTIGQYLTAFFSPAKLTTFDVTPEAKMVLDLMEQSGDQNVLPRVVDKYIDVEDPLTKRNKRIDLTAEQFSKLQKKVGEEVMKKLNTSSLYLSNPNIKMDNKVKKMKDILTEVGQRARNDIRVEMGYKKKQIR